jgi:hypothetical protein
MARILRYGGIFLGLVFLVQGAVAIVGGPDLIRTSGTKWRGLGTLADSLFGPAALQFLSAFFWLGAGGGLLYCALRYKKRAP